MVMQLFRRLKTLFVDTQGRAPSTRRSMRHRYRAMLEVLEDRTVPAPMLVNTTADTPDADLTDGIARDAMGLTSLRAAIQQGNLSTLESVIINFDVGPNAVITLNTVLPTLDRNFDIRGPGAEALTVERNANAVTAFRVFRINVQTTVIISGITIANGKATAMQDGL
ncbi:MAG: hypothetical protein L0Z53_23615, partial [Acidobacteriales bacterium]|nr:hypothetical protein [Terriglobales bacterium]